MSARKLWKVTFGRSGRYVRPESKAKTYEIYVPNARGDYRFALEYGTPEHAEQLRHITVWVDERDGQGWQRYEDIDLATWGAP
jgi:hypothetical protein